jgi:hypothetical protein
MPHLPSALLVAPLLGLGLVGSAVLATGRPGLAEPPPPPPPSFPIDAVPAVGYSLPSSNLPIVSPGDAAWSNAPYYLTQQPYYYSTQPYSTQPYSTQPIAASQAWTQPATFNQSGYLIYVPASSEAALRSAQRIEPNAIVRQWRGQSVIQAGFFQDPKLASARLQALATQGLTQAKSEYVSSGTSTIGPGTGIGGGLDRDTDRAKRYYVVIPSAPPDFYPIRQNLQSIVRSDLVFSGTNSHRGPYIGIGPFTDRASAAAVESRLIQGNFDNARVYFGSF